MIVDKLIDKREIIKYFGVGEYFLIDGFYPFVSYQLNEAYETPNFIGDIADRIVKRLQSFKFLGGSSFEKNIVVNVSDITTYFNKIDISIKYVKDSTANFYNVGYYANTINTKDIEISIEIYANFFDVSAVKSNLFHELLHAYEDKILKGKYGHELAKKMYDSNYELWIFIIQNKSSFSNCTYDFAYLMYSLNDIEILAKIAQIKPECEEIIDDIMNSGEPMNEFAKTSIYKNMKLIERLFQKLENISDKDTNKIIEEVNFVATQIPDNGQIICKHKFNDKDFVQCKKYVITNWTRFQHKFRVNASKIIHDMIQKRQLQFISTVDSSYK